LEKEIENLVAYLLCTLLHLSDRNPAIRRLGCDGVMGFFYKYNIHPYSECLKRQEALEKYANQVDLSVIYQEGYDLEGFIRGVVYRESNRCEFSAQINRPPRQTG
jgi:predicted adenine nucleotide alpha hydrolase (AANH) superfamily ATPase